MKLYSKRERIGRNLFIGFSMVVLIFLVIPVLVVVPLSFNPEPYFSFTKEMLTLQPEGFSTRWYQDFFESDDWIRSVKNSIYIAFFSTLIATILGTLASLGLSRSEMPFRNLIMSLMISPLVVPIIISAVGMYFFFSTIDLDKTYLGAILSHAVLGTPFVVITVTATLSGFNYNLIRAAQNLGANGWTIFRRIIAPLIAPGIISGGLFAFTTSFDEVVVILFVGGFDQRTVTVQMWAGIREQISPTILAVATMFFIVSVCMLTTLELIRRRNLKLRVGE